MSEWKEITLVELTTKIGSGATPRGGSNSYKDDGISLIRSQNVLDLQFTTDGLVFIDEEQADGLKNVIVEKKDVLLNITGDSVARVCMVPNFVLPARVNQHVSIIRADIEKAIPEYLLYNLISQKEDLLMQSEIGATRKAITKGMIEQFELKVPPLEEQNSIASVLSSLDDKIDLLHRQNQTLEQMAETLFRQWFVEAIQKIEFEGESVKGFQLDKFTKWIEGTIGGEWGKENPQGDYIKPVYCIRGTDIADLNVGLPLKIPQRYVKENKFEKIKPEEGDLIIEISGGTETQSTGRVTYINSDIENLFDLPMVFSNFCRMIKVKKPQYSFFIYCYIQYLYNQDEFFNLENGSSGIKNLDYKALLLELDYPMPEEELVLKFNEVAQPFFKKVNKNKTHIRNLTALRDTLLPKLMSGEVRVEI